MTILEPQDEERASSQPEIIVTLIHGTFAQGAAWVRPGSALRAGLESAFGNRITFHQFEWSGDNTVYARMEAGHELGDHIKTISASHPEARQILVAHSHGGNVALYALRDLRADANVVGVACISTPFLHASMRDVRLFDRWTLASSFYGLFCLGVSIIWFPWAFLGGPSWGGWLAFAIFAAIGPWISLGLGYCLANYIVESRENASNVAAQLDCRVEPFTNLFIVRKVGDEASLALGASQAISWATTRAFAHLSAQVSWSDQRPLRWFVVWFERVLSGVALLALAGAASLASFAFGTYLPRNALKGSNIRWGPLASMVLALSIEINTEATPVGLWRIRQFAQTADDRRADNKTLVHSAYDDPAAITSLIRWIDRRTRQTGD